jgi:hypothetical protein
MATALRIPRGALAQTITIDPTLTPTPQGALLASDTPVQFTNNSGYTINITFYPNPPAVSPNPAGPTMFTNITNLLDGQTSQQLTPNPTTGSVNYKISAVGGSTTGPFAIQEGTAPIYVIFSDVASAPECTPSDVAVPDDGSIEMTNYDTNTYGVGWVTDPLSPPLNSVGGAGGNSARTATGALGIYTYSATLPRPNASGGGGKVRVVSN